MNNISINVFGYEKQVPCLVYILKEKFNMLNLLLITYKGKRATLCTHRRLQEVYVQPTKQARRKHFCMHSLQCFKSEIVLNNHTENCIIINGAQAIKMPKADDMIYFKNYHKGLAAPFVIYANFEAINEKVHGFQPNADKSHTESYQKHEDCGYGYKVLCRYDDKYSKPDKIYREENAVSKFMDKMLEEVEWCKK